MIYIFHYYGIYGTNLYPLDCYAIVIFVFLSGYFSYIGDGSKKKRLLEWLLRRVKAIMIPYWMVIIFVIFVNEIYQYKDTSFLEQIIILCGGSMFLNDPLYVVSWFITLILILYLYIFFFQTASTNAYKFFIFIIGLSFSIQLNKHIYFLAFSIGHLIKFFQVKYHFLKNKERFSKLNKIIFNIQNYCYSFFLLHGGVLLLSIKIFKLHPVTSFIASLILTAIFSFYHYKISLLLIRSSLFSFERKIASRLKSNVQ